METSENKQNKLSRQMECCTSVEKPVCKSWKIILGKSKDDISLNNFCLIWHNDFLRISFTSQLAVWFTVKLPALQKLWFIVYLFLMLLLIILLFLSFWHLAIDNWDFVFTYVVQEEFRMCSCLASGICALILTSSGKTVCHILEKNRNLGLLCGVFYCFGGISFSVFCFRFF